MQQVVLIMGTNGTGKSSAARGILGNDFFVDGELTFKKDYSICLIGNYKQKFGGVDGLNRVIDLHELIKKGLERSNLVIAEGVKLHSFGLSIQKAASVCNETTIVLLVAGAKTIDERIKKRGGRGVTAQILKDQKNCLSALIKFKQIGVRTMIIKTDNLSTDFVAQKISTIWDATTLRDGLPK